MCTSVVGGKGTISGGGDLGKTEEEARGAGEEEVPSSTDRTRQRGATVESAVRRGESCPSHPEVALLGEAQRSRGDGRGRPGV